jgi:hypothetical protein
MKAFIDQDPSDFDKTKLITWLEHPGRFGELQLGADAGDMDEEAWFGDEDGPEPPDEPEEGWEQLAAHHGVATVTDGKIDSLSYTFRVLTPVPMCFSPEPKPNTRVDDLWAELTKVLTTKLGKPTKRSKKKIDFAWDNGEITLERSTSNLEPWAVIGLEVRCSGEAPL